MATPTLGNVPATLGTNGDADALTGWTITSGAVDTDLKKEGSGSVFGILRNDLSVGYYDIIADSGSAQNMTGLHVRMFIWFNSVGLLDIEANNGMEFYMYDGTNTAYWVAFGGDTYEGGWFNHVLDCDSTPDSGSFDKTIVQRWGWRYNRTSAPRNVDNTWLDYARTGDGYYATGGTSGDEIDLPGIATVDATNGYGIIELIDGVYFSRGEIQVGNGATTTWFEMIGEVLVYVDAPVATALYSFRGEGTGCRVNIENSVIQVAGGAQFTFDMDDADIVDFDMAGSFVKTGGGVVTFKSGQVSDACVFDGCGEITHGGSTMNNCTVQGYEGTASTGAISYNVAVDPDGEMDDMVITKGTAATHAIDFGTTSPLTMTLTGCDFSGYNATDEQNDSTFRFRRTTGTITLNLIGCSGNMSYKKEAGATVDLVISPVVTKFTVVDISDQSVIENARVWLVASDGTGDLPYQAAITSIARVTDTATVTTTAVHGLTTGDFVYIQGATEDQYNGTFQIIVTSTTIFTYTVPGTPSTPAGGTKTCTGGLFNTLTNASGIAQDTRSWNNDQPVTGWTRKASSHLVDMGACEAPYPGPFYKTQPVSGIIDTTTGLSVTVSLILDE